MNFSELAKGYVIKTKENIKVKHKTPAGELINEFMEEVNKEIRATPYYFVKGKDKNGEEVLVKKPLRQISFIAVKMKLRAISENEQALREFMSHCKDYQNRHKSFSKAFYGALKIK